jgi:hypothetical protein
MSDRSSQTTAMVDHLIQAIVQKLEANRTVLGKSIHHGRLSWRVGRKNGEIEVGLELKL